MFNDNDLQKMKIQSIEKLRIRYLDIGVWLIGF